MPVSTSAPSDVGMSSYRALAADVEHDADAAQRDQRVGDRQLDS